MKTRAQKWSLALAILLVAGGLLCLLAGREPVHQGQTVTDWIKAFQKPVARAPAPKPVAITPNNPGPVPVRPLIVVRSNSPTTLQRVTNFSNIVRANPVLVQADSDLLALIRSRQPPGMTIITNRAADGSITYQVSLQLPAAMAPSMPAVFQPDGDALKSDPACVALRTIGPPALPYLIKALTRQERTVDAWLNKVWAKCPPSFQSNYFKQPFPALTLRRNAAQLLELLDDNQGVTVPALIGALEDPDMEVRRHAIRALGRHGERARPAVPALMGQLTNRFSALDEAAFMALDRIGFGSVEFERAVEQWIRTRASPAQIERLLSSRSLRGEDTARVLGRLLPLWTGSQRYVLLHHLEYIGPKSAVVLPQLMPLLNNTDHETRYLAIRVLRAIGPKAAGALPELERIREAESGNMLATAAKRSIAVIKGEAKPDE